PAIATRYVGPTATNVVIVARSDIITDPGHGSLLRSRSTNGGATWDNPTIIADGTSMLRFHNDAAMAYDAFGNLFLTYLTDTVVVLYYSTDDGLTFNRFLDFDGSYT